MDIVIGRVNGQASTEINTDRCPDGHWHLKLDPP
jgi:hypothetical protein